MKHFIIIAAYVLPRALAADGGISTVRFANKDHLSGNLESLTTETLVWSSSILDRPTPFRLDKVLDMTLSAEQHETQARHEASITLTNGDLVRGQLAGVSDEAIALDTWFAGRMTFNRLMISDIHITERLDFIYRGPVGLDGWKMLDEKPAWTYQNSALRSKGAGGIARDVDLPQEVSVAFDLEWRDRLQFKFVIFADEGIGDSPASGYELHFQQRSVSLRSHMGKEGASRFIGHSSNVSSLQENEKARIEVRASTKAGKISLYINGEIIENWSDPEFASNSFGKSIQFVSQNSLSVGVSRIEVGAWDGEIERMPDRRFPQDFRGFGNGLLEEQPKPEPEIKSKNGRMEMRNGDSLAGEVIAVEGDLIRVKTPFREVKLPIESLRSLSLKPVDLERCIRKNGDVRAWFPDGASIVFRLNEVKGDTITGYSQNFGTANFKLAAFNRIEFNIYEHDLNEIRESDGS